MPCRRRKRPKRWSTWPIFAAGQTTSPSSSPKSTAQCRTTAALRIQRAKPRLPARSVAAPLWIAAGACLALLALLPCERDWLGAIASAVGFVRGRRRRLGDSLRATVSVVRPSVRSAGPTATDRIAKSECAPNGKVVASLAEIAAKLRDLPDKGPGRRQRRLAAVRQRSRSKRQPPPTTATMQRAVRQYCRGHSRHHAAAPRIAGPTVDGESTPSVVVESSHSARSARGIQLRRHRVHAVAGLTD